MDRYNYHRDHRTWDISAAYTVVETNPRRTSVQFCESLVDELIDSGLFPEGWDGRAECDTKYEVCSQCEGSGTMVDPAVDAGGLIAEDFAEDPEFEDAYWGGQYDVQCSLCEGKRVVPVMEFPERIAAAVREWEKDEADHARACAMERAMGC